MIPKPVDMTKSILATAIDLGYQPMVPNKEEDTLVQTLGLEFPYLNVWLRVKYKFSIHIERLEGRYYFHLVDKVNKIFDTSNPFAYYDDCMNEALNQALAIVKEGLGDTKKTNHGTP